MRKTRIFTPEEEFYIVATYKATKSLAKIRRDLQTSVDSIKETLSKNGIKVTMRKTTLDIEYFKKIDTPEKAYWLGFIAADGCIHKHKYKLSFCMKDSDILFKFQKAINASSPVRHRLIFDKRTGKTNEQYNLQICSKEFCQYIKNHGVDENKSKVFNFPKIEEKFYSHFIRGLYDGDGSIHVRVSPVKKRVNFRINMISSLSCIKFIKNYLENNKLFTVNKIFSKDSEGIHYLIMMKDAVKFLHWIYTDSLEETRLNRKFEKFISNIRTYNEQVGYQKN